jgi:hypothetical protein
MKARGRRWELFLRVLIAIQNVTSDMEDVKRLCEEIFHSADKEELRPFCEHLMKLEKDYHDMNAYSDNAVILG